MTTILHFVSSYMAFVNVEYGRKLVVRIENGNMEFFFIEIEVFCSDFSEKLIFDSCYSFVTKVYTY